MNEFTCSEHSVRIRIRKNTHITGKHAALTVQPFWIFIGKPAFVSLADISCYFVEKVEGHFIIAYKLFANH